MCGIFLVIDEEINLTTTIPIFKKLVNRGPDYHKYWHYQINNKKQIFLGQTTLSITGNYNVNNYQLDNFQLLFNGEIYNYQSLNINKELENDDSDTKYLLYKLVQSLTHNKSNELKAIESVNDELDGMYAYLLYNKENNKLYISRDIQGEKNLYYYNQNGIMVIASEISLIIDYLKTKGINIELEKEEFKKYLLSRHHMYRNKSVHQNIFQLQPGETIIYDIVSSTLQESSVRGLDSLIDVELYKKYSKMSFEEHLDIFDNLFQQLADNMVPKHCDYACIVSGGVDSSLSAHYFMQTDNKPKYFIATNCLGKDKISDDLSIHSKALGKDIITIPVTAEDYSQEISVCQSVYSGVVPTHSAITLSILARKVKESGIKVLFTGEGADELYGGYSTYLTPNQKFDDNQDKLLDYFNGLETNYSNYSKLCNNEIEYNNDEFRKDFKQELVKYWQLSKKSYDFLSENKLEKFYQASLLCDSLIQLPNVGLKSADLMCMNHGVESRTIFLRKPLLRMILNSPIWLKLDMRTQFTKILLKELYLKYFPYRSLLPKQGFAGFPNESKQLLEKRKQQNNDKKEFNINKKEFDINKKEFDIREYLDFKDKDIKLSRDMEWKLINMEFYLQSLTSSAH